MLQPCCQQLSRRESTIWTNPAGEPFNGTTSHPFLHPCNRTRVGVSDCAASSHVHMRVRLSHMHDTRRGTTGPVQRRLCVTPLHVLQESSLATQTQTGSPACCHTGRQAHPLGHFFGQLSAVTAACFAARWVSVLEKKKRHQRGSLGTRCDCCATAVSRSFLRVDDSVGEPGDGARTSVRQGRRDQSVKAQKYAQRGPQHA